MFCSVTVVKRPNESRLKKWGYDIRIKHFPRKGELVGHIKRGNDKLASLEGEALGKKADVGRFDIEVLFKSRGRKREMSDLLFWALEKHLKGHDFHSICMYTNASMGHFLRKHRGWDLKSRDQYEDFEVRKDLRKRVHAPKRWSESPLRAHHL